MKPDKHNAWTQKKSKYSYLDINHSLSQWKCLAKVPTSGPSCSKLTVSLCIVKTLVIIYANSFAEKMWVQLLLKIFQQK